MRRLFIGGRLLVFVMVLGLIITGCSSRGVVNPGWTVVAAENDTVYSVLASGKVVAMDAATGTERWYYPITPPSSGGLGGLFAPKPSGDQDAPLNAVYGQPVFTNDYVIVGSFDNKLHAFNRSTGQQAWEYVAGGSIIGGATVYDNIIYFGASDSRVYAIRPTDAGAEVVWNPVISTHGIWGSPVVDEQHVYVGSMDHHVYALDRQTGELVWDHDMGAAVPGGVSLAGDLLLVGGVAKKLSALQTSSGNVIWEHQFNQWVWGEALVDAGVIYVTTLDGQVHAVNPQDGSVRWDAQLEGAMRAGPSMSGDYLVVGTDTGNIYRLAKTDGKAEKLYAAAGASILAPIAVLGNQVFVGTTTATVIALDVTRGAGAPLWIYPTPKQ